MGIPDEDEVHANIVLMGGARVGKTALIHRLLQYEPSDALHGKYKPTIEDSYMREFLVGDHSCKLRLVDTAGNYSFPAMQKLWVKRASAFILVCARNEPDSVNQLKIALDQIREERQDTKWPPLMVIAINKCDLHMKEWVVSDDAVEALADQYHIPYTSIVLTSAFIDMGVMKMMRCLWCQNEEAGPDGIQFEQQTTRGSKTNRRSSAFAVLLKPQNAAKKSVLIRRDSQTPERSPSLSPQSVTSGSVRRTSNTSVNKLLTKTFRKLSIGSKEKSSTSSLTVIDMQCSIS